MYKAQKIKLDNQLNKWLIKRCEKDSLFYTYSLANKYLKTNKRRKRTRSYSGADYVRDVASFLDYLEENVGKDPEKYLSKITIDDANEFLLYFCHTLNQDGNYPGDIARIRKRNSIGRFLENLQDAGINSNLQNYYEKDEKTKRLVSNIQNELIIEMTRSKPEKPLLRACPEYFIDSFLKYSKRYKPNCWVAANFSGVTGLRPAEVLNLRHPCSEYGTNIDITRQEGIIVAISIDIRKEEWERPLSSNNTPVGRIKRPRLVGVYPKYLKSFEDAYDTYLKMTQFYEREKQGPLIVQKRVTHKTEKHMAYNYQNYYMDFKEVCQKYVIPELLEMGGEPEYYAKQLSNSRYGPHMFRHAFSCRLADEGAAWNIIQFYRGDKTPDTAAGYLLNGGAFDSCILCNATFIEEKMKEKGKEFGLPALPRSL